MSHLFVNQSKPVVLYVVACGLREHCNIKLCCQFKNSVFYHIRFRQPDLMAICTYFTRWLIRTTSLVQNHKIFAKSYVFYELHNSYELV